MDELEDKVHPSFFPGKKTNRDKEMKTTGRRGETCERKDQSRRFNSQPTRTGAPGPNSPEGRKNTYARGKGASGLKEHTGAQLQQQRPASRRIASELCESRIKSHRWPPCQPRPPKARCKSRVEVKTPNFLIFTPSNPLIFCHISFASSCIKPTIRSLCSCCQTARYCWRKF